jgi:tetratricopeptide (TPR) repeat protein
MFISKNIKSKKIKTNLLKIIFIFLFTTLIALLISNTLTFSKIDTKEIYYYLNRNDIYNAEKLVYEVLKEDQFNPDALFAKAIIIIVKTDNNTYLKKEDKKEYYKESLNILLSLEKKMKGFYYYHYILAKNYEKLNDIPNALFNYDYSIKLNRKFNEGYISLSNLYWKLKKYNQAIDNLKNVKDIKAYLMLSNFYYQLYKFDESFKMLNNIYLIPTFSKSSKEIINEVYFQSMWIKYRYYSKYLKNKEDLNYFIEQNKKYNSDEYYNTISNAIDLILKGDNISYEKALEILFNNISKFPNKSYSYFLIYKILLNFNKANAILFLKKAIEIDIYNLDFHNELNNLNSRK